MSSALLPPGEVSGQVSKGGNVDYVNKHLEEVNYLDKLLRCLCELRHFKNYYRQLSTRDLNWGPLDLT